MVEYVVWTCQRRHHIHFKDSGQCSAREALVIKQGETDKTFLLRIRAFIVPEDIPTARDLRMKILRRLGVEHRALRVRHGSET